MTPTAVDPSMARFAEIAKAAGPNRDRIVELATELAAELQQRGRLETDAITANRDRPGYGPRRARFGMPNSEWVDGLTRDVRALSLNGLPLPLPNDLPESVYKGKT